MLGAPTEEAKIVVPDEWWTERRANAYEALKAGKPKLAYELVREAGPLSANPLKDQSFMAGWLALRYLKDPALAEHALPRHAQGRRRPIEPRQGRATGSAARPKPRNDKRRRHRILPGGAARPGCVPRPARTPEARARTPVDHHQGTGGADAGADPTGLLDLDAAKAVVIAKKSGLDISHHAQLHRAAPHLLKSEAEAAMVAHLAEAIGDTQSAVRAGKTAIARGQNLVYYAYPVHPVPGLFAAAQSARDGLPARHRAPGDGVQYAHVSGAGAKGLLQVMTVTAKHVCRDYKIKCDIERLLTDPSYNAMLASAYIGDRMAEFSGSYVLTIAGYNAGTGARAAVDPRVRRSRAIPRSTPSIGSSAFRSRRRASTWARCWPTSRCTGHGSARSKRRSGSRKI